MKNIILILTALFLIRSKHHSQTTLLNPTICHDANNYLKCYNDGSYIIKFDKGVFTEFLTLDTTFHYDGKNKVFTFYQKASSYGTQADTIEFKLLKQSLLIKKRGIEMIIDSATKITDPFNNLGLGFEQGTYKINSINLQNGNKDLQLKISTFFKTWSWDIIIREPQKIFAATYLAFKNKGLSQIFISDDYLKYGMQLHTHFGKNKRITAISAQYSEIMTNNKGYTYSQYLELNNPYLYTYKRNKKLNLKKMKGKLSYCNCD